MKTLFFLKATLAMLVFGCILNAETRTVKKPATDTLYVEVLLYSGRPNPVFTITDPVEIKTILSAAKAAPKQAVAKTTAKKAALGYKGIAVEFLAAGSDEATAFTVKDDEITLSVSSPTAAKATTPDVRSDSGRALQRRLLGKGMEKGVLTEQLVSFIENGK